MWLNKRRMDYYDLLSFTGCPRIVCQTLREVEQEMAPVDSYLGKSSYLYGLNGTGKTVFASHILMQEMIIRHEVEGSLNYYLDKMDHGRSSLDYDSYYVPKFYQVFCWYPRLLQKIKRTFKKDYDGPSESELVDPLLEAEMLILDDIGPEQTTDWSYNLLYLIIGERYNEELPTIITSNLSLPELSKKMKDTRIPSRIAGMCGEHIYRIEGADRRIK